MNQQIIVIGEHEQGTIKPYTYEVAAKAAQLAQESGGSAAVLLVGKAAEANAASLGEVGVNEVVVLDCAALDAGYNSDGYTAVLTTWLQSRGPAAVIGSATPFGRDCLARVATRLETGLIADSVALSWADDRLLARHPVYAGKALVDAVVTTTPQMVLLRPNAIGAPERQAGATATVSVESAEAGELRAVVSSVVEQEQSEVDLTEANIIVSGGRALGSAENFKYIRELAQTLGASVGASRAAVDAGYISHDHQVGQTGKVVNPSLYIACGISGAIQHLAGMRTSRYIVAINKDPDAPIFSKADFGIVGDLFQVVPALTEKIAEVVNS